MGTPNIRHVSLAQKRCSLRVLLSVPLLVSGTALLANQFPAGRLEPAQPETKRYVGSSPEALVPAKK